MLIFGFKYPAKASEFATACREHGKDAWVWESQESMHAAFIEEQEGSDIFPFVIDGTVVTVDRDEDHNVERTFQEMVLNFGGKFVGT